MSEKPNMKKQIFLGSIELFGMYSYSRVSVRDIAKKIGIKSASIYNHYKSKEEILDDIFSYYIDKVHSLQKGVSDKISQPDYEPRLKDLELVYAEEDQQLMFWITRIIFMEQFTSEVAANALLGVSHMHYNQCYDTFFNILYKKGIVKNKDNIPMYREMIMRMGHSFQLDYVHPEFEPSVKSLYHMFDFMFKLIFSYEGALDKYDEFIDRTN